MPKLLLLAPVTEERVTQDEAVPESTMPTLPVPPWAFKVSEVQDMQIF